MAADPPDPLILTASDRLARVLREDHSLAQRAAGRTVWEAPRIQSLQQWLLDTWSGSWPAGQLLHPVQELALWREVIENDAQPVLAPLSAARQARHAEVLALQYRIDLEAASREEHHAFRRWQAAVQKRRGREGWLTGAELPRECAALIRHGRVDVPPAVELAGFLGEIPAGTRLVLEALAAAGATITHRPTPAAAPASLQRRCYPDAEAQFRAIGATIRDRLQPYADREQAPPRIVVAMPDPEARRELVENLFTPLLAPWLLQAEGARPVPWRWERGRPLAEQPWIEAALAACECQAAGTAPEVVSRLLLSAALWDDRERELAARADYVLREAGVPRIRSGRLLAACPPELHERLGAFAGLLERAPRQALPSAWAAHWQARLDALGWPGGSTLDSESFQAVAAWTPLLARLSAMDRQLGPVGPRAALTWLGELARASRHEPRAEHAQPVLLLSLEEAVGLPCDLLFVADCTADAFPGRAAASPYLPLAAQIAAQVPGASPALQLAHARRLAAHLLTLAPETQLSYSAVDERGAERLASPLFGGDWPLAEPPTALCRQEQDSGQPPRAALPESDPAPPVSPAEATGLRATARLFKLWQVSPFFAFCHFRLGARALPVPGAGLDARTQGEVMHGVLEDVWSRLADSAALAAAGDTELQREVDAALRRRLPARMPEADYGRAQLALEHARMLDVLMQWLRHERRRVEPFAVTAQELEVRTEVAGLPLRLRMDRVDRVQTALGERWLVMDYKTSREAKPAGWRAEKLTEPQLPLYASLAARAAAGIPRVDGICFGHLKDGHPALVARTNWRELLIEGPAGAFDDHWEQTLAAWRQVLELAAGQFLRGEAQFDPNRSYWRDDEELLPLTGSGLREEELP